MSLIWGKELPDNDKDEKSCWTRKRKTWKKEKKRKHLFLIVCEKGVLVFKQCAT